MKIEMKLDFSAISGLTDEQFYQICRDNLDIKFERNSQGEILIISSSGGETGIRNFDIIGQFGSWNNRYKLGYCFDSSTCFKFPNGANRSPDVSFILKERWETLSLQDREKFPPIVPDFVLELMSPSDSLKDTQEKMAEYRDNGVKLGWLINGVTAAPGACIRENCDRKNRQVEIYRQQQAKEILENPSSIYDRDILPNFILNLETIW
ncbi:MAG: Uma2 family endonuclease [Microcoleaceae cyanobacterium]